MKAKAYRCPACGAEYDTPVWCSGFDPEPDVDESAHALTRATENTGDK